MNGWLAIHVHGCLNNFIKAGGGVFLQKQEGVFFLQPTLCRLSPCKERQVRTHLLLSLETAIVCSMTGGDGGLGWCLKAQTMELDC